MILLPLLCYAVLVLWIDERWAWAAFQSAIFVLTGARIIRRERLSIPVPCALLAGAALWPLLQLAMATSVSPGETWSAALNWLTFLLVFALACEIRPDRFLQPASIFGLLLAAVALLQQASAGGRIFWIFPSGYSDNVLGPFVNRNQYSAWMELLIPAALYLTFTDRRLRWLHGLSAAVMFGSVIAAGSRAGVALAALEILTTAILLSKRQPLPRKVLAAAACLFLLVAAVAGWQTLQAGMHRHGAEELRIDALKASYQMIRAHPWTGWGLGSWPDVYPRFAGLDTGLYLNQAHNDWAQWTAEGGLPFTALLVLFAGLLCKRAWRSIYGIGTLAFLLHALVDYPMQQRPALAGWFFAMAGIAFHSSRQNATNHGLLRRVRHLSHRIGPGDTGVLQEAGPAGSPGPLRRPGAHPAR